MKTFLFSISALLLAVILLAKIPGAWSDADQHGEWYDDDRQYHSATDVAPVNNNLYREECGSCHIAYPPGLLPSASWRSIMQGLSDHFGEDAGLEQNSMQEITEYLVANSAEKSDSRRSRAFAASLAGFDSAVLRITETPYFLHEHDEIPARIRESKQVVSMSQCDNCHRKAASGSFNEHDIWIKGFGKWDD
jgi:hypothetical protein